MPLKYLLSKPCRYKYEVEAYKTSIEFGLNVNVACEIIHDNYNLQYTVTEIKKALERM